VTCQRSNPPFSRAVTLPPFLSGKEFPATPARTQYRDIEINGRCFTAQIYRRSLWSSTYQSASTLRNSAPEINTPVSNGVTLWSSARAPSTAWRQSLRGKVFGYQLHRRTGCSLPDFYCRGKHSYVNSPSTRGDFFLTLFLAVPKSRSHTKRKGIFLLARSCSNSPFDKKALLRFALAPELNPQVQFPADSPVYPDHLLRSKLLPPASRRWVDVVLHNNIRWFARCAILIK